jgi:hypothetical protein
MFSTPWKLKVADEQIEGHNCLFRRSYYKNRGHNPEKCSGLISGEDGFSVYEKLIAVDD